MVILEILVSVFIVSLMSLLGIVTLYFREKTVEKSLFALVSLSAGALLGVAFLDLIPESFEYMDVKNAMLLVLAGFLLFFILEKFILWHHCHDAHCRHKDRKTALPYLNIIGDGVHNILDGMVIAVAYLADPSLGVITTIAVIAHEIPQEIGDFGILLYSGMDKTTALLVNFFTALTAMLGAIAILILNVSFESITSLLLPLAAGHFIYIAAADLIPELQKTVSKKESVLQFVFILLGILLVVLIGEFFAH
ncbi:MAG: ZIP family metal transporter [Candidatus Micrarchaeota archaeon]|nr:ZIP family metal transporter [Candidatus Micrarchaeota archaeon]